MNIIMIETTCPFCKCTLFVPNIGLPGICECHCGNVYSIAPDGKSAPASMDDLMIKNRGVRVNVGTAISDAAVRAFSGVGFLDKAFGSARTQAPDESIKSAARQTAADILDEGAAVYRQRNALYGDSYKDFGKLMLAMFPNGLPPLKTVEDYNRLGVFIMMVSKMTRYATNLGTGGHRDSALDLSVYAAMLCEITEEKK